jgi:hypothetical protein
MLTFLRNYWTPLASQVKELDKPTPPMDLLLSIQYTPARQVKFVLSPYHVNKDSTAWQRGRPPNEQTLYRIDPLAAQNNMRMSILSGTIPSAVSNIGDVSSNFLMSDPSLPTGRVFSTVFHLPNGAVAPAIQQPPSTNCSTMYERPPRMSTLFLHWSATCSSAPANLLKQATQPSTTRTK